LVAKHREKQKPVNGIELPRSSVFKYLESAVASDDKLMVEVKCMRAAWFKRRSLTCALCDRKIPERLKSKIYKAVIRPVAVYGAKCWPVIKEVETRLSVMAMKMLRWTAGVTRMDSIRIDAIRQNFGVAPIAGKLREARLRWYAHVLLGEEESVRRIGLNFEVIGKQLKGRPKQHWSDQETISTGRGNFGAALTLCLRAKGELKLAGNSDNERAVVAQLLEFTPIQRWIEKDGVMSPEPYTPLKGGTNAEEEEEESSQIVETFCDHGYDNSL
uniref:Reverse transcriptase n=1 Tax=Heligmosomoides polygyrus TaxID=6339 RepID=A0A183F5Q1_HELPZ